MIEQMITEIFGRIGQTWIVGGRTTEPTEDDVLKVLDTAAKDMYDRGCKVGDQFQTGGLVIEKAPHGHDVYVYVGTYT